MKEGVTLFVPLQVYSDYSILESCIRIPELVKLAASYGYSYLGLTDHNTAGGLVEFYQHCEKHQINPILGLDLDISGFLGLDRIVFLAENITGYHNLLALASLPKPVDKRQLIVYQQGLICLINVKNLDTITNDYTEIAKIFGKENVYLQLHTHTEALRQQANQLVRLFPTEVLVASLAIKYLTEEQRPVLQVLQALKANVSIDEITIDATFLWRPEQVAESFSKLPQVLYNGLEIAKRCQVNLQQKLTLPKISNTMDLRQLVFAGAVKRYAEISTSVRERLEDELAVIEEMGLADYFLLVQDIVAFAKRAKIPVGPGRGSAAGSLVAYCLGITNIDPLEHNLFFERFLNRERRNLPDIDLDFCYQRREEVVNYLIERFGEEHVAKIGAYGTFGQSLAAKEVNKLIKDQKLAQAIIPRLVGLKHHFTTHAAGIIITPEPVIKYSALEPNASHPVTQADMNSLENLGVLKIDLLSLRNLTILADIEAVIQEQEPDFTLEQIPLADQKTYQLLASGQTLGVFQIESSLFQDLLPQIKPTCFEDLVALLALGRPGPLKQVPTYIKRREQKEKIEYLHPLLEPILAETFGLILYQEQVMQVAHELAGFGLEEADLFRVAMSKKDHQLIQQLKAKFIAGCRKQGLAEISGQRLFAQIESFADYAFNKAHSAAYSIITWQTAYLKANYPLEFYLVQLKHAGGSFVRKQEFFLECLAREIGILGPDIRYSEIDFTKEGRSIRIGLASLKYLGLVNAEKIIAARKQGQFVSLQDFLGRVPLTFNVVENLLYSGALDGFGLRRQLLQEISRHFNTTIPQLTDLELLEREKEIVGLYLSNHPLSGWKVFLDYLVENFGQCFAGHIIELKVDFQDITGKLAGENRLINFKMAKNQYQICLQSNSLVALFGKFQDHLFQAEWVLPLKPMLILQPKMETIAELQEFLKLHQGDTPVLLNIQKGAVQIVAPQFWLAIDEQVLAELKEYCHHAQWIDPWEELKEHYRN